MSDCSAICVAFRRAIGIAALGLAASVARAQAPTPPAGGGIRAPGASSRSTVDQLERALRLRHFEEAARLIERRLADGDRDPILLYNSACVFAQLGKLADAERRLMESVKAGFRDFDTMAADDDLAPIRGSDTYKAILEARREIERETGRRVGTRREPDRPGSAAARDPVAAWKERHPSGYRYDMSDDETVSFATYLDEASHARMKASLSELGRHLMRAYFSKPPSEPVLVAIVRPEDAKEYLERPEIRGMYLHRARRLVARDAGQSLQHEYVHLLHFAQMERTGQRHPIWVQEGLASLYEDYTLHPDGRVEFHPNIRFNFARKQVLAETTMPWATLFRLSADAFMDDAEQLYPTVRAIFEFFARERRLEAFYRELCRTTDTDPDGSTAVEKAFGEPLRTVEQRWRKWMLERGELDDTIDADDASLGVTIEDAGDGVRIRGFVLRSAAKAAGLLEGDVIIDVGGTPVRNRDEMLLAVAKLKVGEETTVRFRRNGREESAAVVPRALGR